MRASCPAAIAALLLLAPAAEAALISVTTADNWTTIESAVAGDVVEIAPGTYKFRVMLSKTGTASNPITIKAKDPKNRPVWDLAGKVVGAWPGSYTAPDKHRGAWQIKGGHYVISGIIFKNAQDSSSAGIRVVNSGPVKIHDCVFDGNTNGITGSSSDMVVEFTEFNDNGKKPPITGNATHNLYIYGGKFTLRYSYLHDPVEGQNFHVRAADALIEYNWITRPASYPGDIMTCENQCGGTGTNPITQKMLLRGNVIVQGSPSNTSQIIALFDDENSASNDKTGRSTKMALTMINNTVIATPKSSGTHKLVNMRNDGIDTDVVLHNNIFYQMGELAAAYTPSLTNWSVTGSNNWVGTGTKINGTLTGTISGSSPGFVNAASKDYHLTSSSACLNKAATVSGLPTKEYYLNEVTKLQYRPRAAATELGAFEFGNTASAVGPYGTTPPPTDGGITPTDAGPPPDQGVTPDKSVPTPDKSVPTPDKSVPKPDKSVPKPDKGVTKLDTGTTPTDANPAGDGPVATSDGPISSQDGSAVDAPQTGGDGGLPLDGLEGGCGCRVSAAPSAGAGASALLLLIALALLLRRRSRASKSS